MGLSSLPTPSQGMLYVLSVNAAMSLSAVKGILRSILQIVGIRISAPSTSSPDLMPTSPDSTDDSPDSMPSSPHSVFRNELAAYHSAAEVYLKDYRSRIPTTRLDTLSSSQQPEHDCPVCRCEFEPDAEVDLLPCSHLFHKECLETWLRYLRGTCPVCRYPLLFDEVNACY
ncbi:hypothetical protein F3Y22_tig00111088pilonHSYRG00068 [Hibiscus syriacus]|uniref:RING-type domain-containing protein n=1 Tax=Hibiscus syriacus TaxID=106335 RepID=A0A6A2Z260_HIBSY|nr:probable E3 ubiquitin-protein ligase XERICO [Hibiscus syriacus]KAE8685876.1 hypothetical protein F3Y22_tig00111088pilonHSYRG00068 [Hibiscus syriacus]